MYGLLSVERFLYTRTPHVMPIKRIVASLFRMYFNVGAHKRNVSEVGF